jgi:hypothetical protein
MDRLALSGIGLATAGLVGILSAEIVGTAYAGRPAERTYFAAASFGSSLRLMPLGSDTTRLAGADAMRETTAGLACSRVVDAGGLKLGIYCTRLGTR